jgi:hypothetical protein
MSGKQASGSSGRINCQLSMLTIGGQYAWEDLTADQDHLSCWSNTCRRSIQFLFTLEGIRGTHAFRRNRTTRENLVVGKRALDERAP